MLLKGQREPLDLMTPAMAVQEASLMAIPDFGASDDSAVFAKEKKALQPQKSWLMVSGAAAAEV